MAEKLKLSPEEKLELLLHILSIMDEQNVISFAEDRFQAYFKEYSKALVDNYLLDLNNKKTLQFMIYGEPGMMNEHFIKVSNPSSIAREIKLQTDMMKAKHKDIVLMVNEENKALRNALDRESGNNSQNEGAQAEVEEQERLVMAAKVNEALEHSKKLRNSLKKNINLQILDGVVQDTQGYLQTVKLISEEYDAVSMALIEPLIAENRSVMKKLTITAALAIASTSLFAVLLLTFFSY